MLESQRADEIIPEDTVKSCEADNEIARAQRVVSHWTHKPFVIPFIGKRLGVASDD